VVGPHEVSVGQNVTVETADGHRFHGRVLELRQDRNGQSVAVLRLDTGWQVSYPVSMTRPVYEARREVSDSGGTDHP